MTALTDFNAACVQAWQSTGLTPTAYEGMDPETGMAFTPPAGKWYMTTLLPVSA